MIGNEYCLELCNVYHSGQVEPASFFQRLTSSVPHSVLLKDVSCRVSSGEVLAVLGSKGSGKRALLDVIARRVTGATRGNLLLHGQPLTLAAFRERAALVPNAGEVVEGLSVKQTLWYTPTKISGYLKKSKIKQVMADLALSQVSNRNTSNLTCSEYRRLLIGIQLMKVGKCEVSIASVGKCLFPNPSYDHAILLNLLENKEPSLLLLDEPTWNLDPLNTYLVISILSNAAKKYGMAVVLTMEKPRSDVFPFLDRVLYLCLGDVVYTGGTRQMLDYFNTIGFPCPQLENPLMYYLCLSTVDRRSRERFMESNHQIGALVEKFKIEGSAFRKGSSVMGPPSNLDPILAHGKMPLPYGMPSGFQVGYTLYTRLLAATFSLTKSGMKQLFLRLFMLPLCFLMLWLFYKDMSNYQHTFVSRQGLIFNSLAAVYFFGIVNTIMIFPMYRTRYYQEQQEGLYSGPLFLFTYNLVSLPFSFCSIVASSAIIFSLVGTFNKPIEYLYFTLILWGCYVFSEQQTMAFLMTIKSNLTAAICSTYVTCVCLTLGSGILRSIKGLQDWLFYLTYATQVRYAAAFLIRQVFVSSILPDSLPFDNSLNCTTNRLIETSNLNSNGAPDLKCKYLTRASFMTERYSRDTTDLIFSGILDFEMNMGATFAFTVGMIIFNMFLYVVPLPTYVKQKFRE